MGKYDSQAKYERENVIHAAFKLNKKTDADIIEKLKTVGNRQGYIKSLIRADMEKGVRSMTYKMAWTLADGTRVTDQIYTADAVSNQLKNLESWGAYAVVIESVE